MSTTPDPQLVRELAEDAIREGARTASIEDVLTGHPVIDHDDPESDYDAWFDAIAAQMPKATVTVSWPDEQQQDDGDVRAVAYPGQPGDGWQDDEGMCWVLCGDGKMRLLVETEEPEDPAELDARFGPMLPLVPRIAVLEPRDTAGGGEVRG